MFSERPTSNFDVILRCSQTLRIGRRENLSRRQLPNFADIKVTHEQRFTEHYSHRQTDALKIRSRKLHRIEHSHVSIKV